MIFQKGTEYQILSKVLDISSAKACVFPDLLKDLVFLSDTTWLRRSETIMEIRKKDTFRCAQEAYYLKFFKYFTNYRKSTNKKVVLSCRSPYHPYIQQPQTRPSNNLKNKIPWDKFQFVCLNLAFDCSCVVRMVFFNYIRDSTGGNIFNLDISAFACDFCHWVLFILVGFMCLCCGSWHRNHFFH